MKNVGILKKVAVFAFVHAAVVSLFVLTSCGKGTFGVRCEIVGDHAVIVRYVGESKNVTVADEYKGVPITEIADEAFVDEIFESITLPDTITKIGKDAFRGTKGMTTVTLGAALVEIGENAFASCSALESINIPEGVTTIGNMAFSECRALRSVTFPSTLENIGTRIFFNCTSLESATLPAKITTAPDGLFAGCSSLKSVKFEGAISPSPRP